MLWIRIFFIFFCFSLDAYTKHPKVSEKIWQEVKPHLLPENHPILGKLESLLKKKSGFYTISIGKRSKVLVKRHPDLKGYLVKELDKKAKSWTPQLQEHRLWIERIRGKNRVGKFIKRHHLEHMFKVPQKWIFPVKSHFILVAEDMGLISSGDNLKKWKGHFIKRAHLDAIFSMVKTVGYTDGLRPDNLCIAKDKKIAIIDTQKTGMWPPNYDLLTKYLSSEMKKYWRSKF